MAVPNTKGPRRRSSIHSKINPLVDGEAAPDFVTHMGKLSEKQRRHLHEQLSIPTKFNCQGFLENKEKNRLPIPINEKRRAKPGVPKPGDTEYVPATYANCDRDEYIIWQAPTKENYLNFWRCIWKDGSRIIVSLTENFSESDENVCYQYFPMKEGTSMKIQDPRYVITCQKITQNPGYAIFELLLTSTDPSDATGQKERKENSEEEEEDPSKPRNISLYHFENWGPEQFPNLDHLAPFVVAVTKKELQLLRKTVDSYCAPVVIQGFHGIGRSSVFWVGSILSKDIEKRDCFDVEELIRKLMKLRPGAFCKKVHFCATFALAFRLASYMGWSSPEEGMSRVREITEAYKASPSME